MLYVSFALPTSLLFIPLLLSYDYQLLFIQCTEVFILGAISPHSQNGHTVYTF